LILLDGVKFDNPDPILWCLIKIPDLESPLSPNNNSDRFDQDEYIQQQGIILDIKDIVFGVQMHWFVAAPIDLLPTGDPMRYSKALSLPVFIFFDQIKNVGSRSSQAHFSR